MEHYITVAGIGPGSPDYLLPVAKKVIENATVLIGSRRALTAFCREDQKSYSIGADIEGVLTYIEKVHIAEKVVVMVSGDPGFYSLLAALREKFGAAKLKVIPGISSVQLAFARVGEFWQDAVLLSMHGRRADDSALVYQPLKKLGFLTDGKHNPAFIAQLLIKQGWPPATRSWLCENLSYDNENIAALTLAEVSQVSGFHHCVMVVAHE
jgi:cobalt-precorrin-7 (C5)-methyltransferase